MTSEQKQEQASLYALGALTPEEAQAFEAELLLDTELRDLVRSLQSTLNAFACSLPARGLPPILKEKVMQRIDASETARRSEVLQSGLGFLMSAAQTGWKPLPFPGTFIKLLSLQRDRGYAVLLGKLEPGARYPAHVNAGPEDFYILTGDLAIGDQKLVAGDFHHADAGSMHQENYSETGCTLLAVLTTDDPLVAFATA